MLSLKDKTTPRISFHAFGCRLNQAELAILQQRCADLGLTVVDDPAQADVVVVNTCTVTAKADADTRQLVHRLSREYPAVRIALVGCQAQRDAARLAALPNVHWVVGNADKMRLPELLAGTAAALPVEHGPETGPFTLPAPGVDRWHCRANLKIQDGCDFYCSYCIVPHVRGPPRSRALADVLAGAQALVAAGHRELVLAGANLGRYQDAGCDLLGLITRLVAVPGLARLRISSLEPGAIPPGFLAFLARTPTVCRHLHLPLQSGDDEMLRRMHRRHTVADVATLIQEAAQTIPGICLGSDVIVGYPGETDAHFARTREVLASLPLAYLHVFAYSPRPGTASLQHGPRPPAPVVAERGRQLRELSLRQRQQFLASFVGATVPVLFEHARAGVCAGLTDNYLRVQVHSARDLTNHLLPVRLQRIVGQALEGVLAP